MAKIYKNQTALTLNFDLDTDITGYTSIVVYARKPEASTATWTATATTASTGAITFATFTTTTLDLAGNYKLQPEVTFSDGTKAKGETVNLRVFDSYE
ncbi:MAG: hypothetical protein SVV88_10990 [Pseudomonadota bacterium]|nr:hypothetical protein [Pseudomonadota bacterium]